MGNFRRDNRDNRDNRGGGSRFFSSNGRSAFGRGGHDDRPREMFKTVCSNCGKDCEVPFRPTTGKPVYCSDCFEKVGGRSSDGGRPERNDRPQAPRFDNNKAQFDALNVKLDKIINLLTPSPVVVEEVKIEKVAKAPKVKKQKEIKEDK